MLALRKYQSPIAFFVLAFITAFLTGCGGGSSTTATTPSISTTTVPDATTGTAYTTSISATGGTAPYTWTLTAGTLPAGLALGSSTTSSVTIVGTPTAAQQGAAFTVQVKDANAKLATKALTMNVVSTLSVAITNKQAGILPAAAAVTFNAAVANDVSNQGVTWTLKANSADCSPTCGTLTNAGTTSALYTPPLTIPASPNDKVTITATSIADTTKSDSNVLSITNSPLSACSQSGNEAALNGKYAFLLQGETAAATSHMVGSFTADGAGHITAGEVDANGTTATHANLDTTATTYSVGADNRGCMTLKTASSAATVVHFALGGLNASVASKGRLIQFDDTLGTGTRATGMMLKQDTAAIATNLSGNYVIHVAGANSAAGRYAATGAMTISGTLVSAGEVDADSAGTATHATGQAGLLSTTLTANGRGTFTFSPTVLFPTTLAFYVVSSSEALVLSTDAVSVSVPVASGELRLQSGTFTNATLNGVSVLHMAGLDSTTRSAAIGTLTTDGAGNATLAVTSQEGATAPVATPTTTTYSVAANGRATLAASAVRVVYLTGANAGFIAGNDTATTTGELEAQTVGPFSASSLTGAYSFGTEAVGSNASNSEVGVVTPDGSGAATVALDISAAVAPLLTIDLNSSGTYTVAADGTATIANSDGIVISPNKAVVLDGGSANANANVIVLEK
jgi:hypothetical protein